MYLIHQALEHGGGSASDEFSSKPQGNGWYVRFDDEVGGFNSYARCCKYASTTSGAPKEPLTCRVVEAHGGSRGTAIRAQCSGDEYVMGGGFHVGNGPPYRGPPRRSPPMPQRSPPMAPPVSLRQGPPTLEMGVPPPRAEMEATWWRRGPARPRRRPAQAARAAA